MSEVLLNFKHLERRENERTSAVVFTEFEPSGFCSAIPGVQIERGTALLARVPKAAAFTCFGLERPWALMSHHHLECFAAS